MNIDEKLAEILDQMWLEVGKIHAEGSDVTHKDLDNIRNKTMDKIKLFISIIRSHDRKMMEEIIPEKIKPATGDAIRFNYLPEYYEGWNECVEVMKTAFQEKMGAEV